MAVQSIPLALASDGVVRTDPANAFFGRVTAAERAFAFFVLVILSPLLLGCACAIVILSRNSPLIAHRRLGLHGRTIWVLKFRTMWRAENARSRKLYERIAPETQQPLAAKRALDPRVTSSFAAFCRKHSLDELPQFWNVVRGEMALVGPRPITTYEVEMYYPDDARELLAVKPGITGLWQVRGRSSLNYHQRRKLDLYLIRHCDAKLYGRILLASIGGVFSGKDAW